jgi:hypothetical protein
LKLPETLDTGHFSPVAFIWHPQTIKRPKLDACQDSGNEPEYDNPQNQAENTANHSPLEKKHRVIMKVFFHNVMDLFKDLNRVGCLHFFYKPPFFTR